MLIGTFKTGCINRGQVQEEKPVGKEKMSDQFSISVAADDAAEADEGNDRDQPQVIEHAVRTSSRLPSGRREVSRICALTSRLFVRIESAFIADPFVVCLG